MTPVGWAVVLLFVVVMLSGLDVALGVRRLVQVTSLPDWNGPDAPLVSIIVPARNEARSIEGAIDSLLAQRYPALEFIAIDDRSDDGTGAILDRMAAGDRRLMVRHLESLPPGWLGKNHALSEGAAAARGEWLLFADADVVLEPGTLGRVMRYAVEQRFDHIALLPTITMPGLLLEAFVAGFGVSFNAYMRPWKARDPKSKCFVGVGAFNLVRGAAYRHAGGHSRIALRPDDDVRLGQVLKRDGAHQDLLLGTGAARVEWYRSFAELEQGLEKNAFSAFQYRPVLSVLASLFHLVMGLAPLVGVVLLRGLPQLLCAVMIGWALILYAFAARVAGLRVRTTFLYPVFIVMFNYVVLRAMVVNLRDGGIRWRGTFYSLDDLRSNRL